MFLALCLWFLLRRPNADLIPSSTGRRRQRRMAVAATTIDSNTDPLIQGFNDLGLDAKQQWNIVQELTDKGLWDVGGNSCSSLPLLQVCQDWDLEQIARMLLHDFTLLPLTAHQCRAAVGRIRTRQSTRNDEPTVEVQVQIHGGGGDGIGIGIGNSDGHHQDRGLRNNETSHTTPQRPRRYKQTFVNDAAARRGTSSVDYGLSKQYASQYPLLATDLEDFYAFMTRPSPYSQEEPIRHATASIYLRHAKLFLGWYITRTRTKNEEDTTTRNIMSLATIIPNKEKESAMPFIDFVLWLRSHRSSSASYEASILRGLTKLVKFRFAKESSLDPNYGGKKTYDDIPVVRELRKLHRMAHKQSQLAPRSSTEERKWLSWPEYLQVVRQVRSQLEELLTKNSPPPPPPSEAEAVHGNNETTATTTTTSGQRRTAIAFQKYLVLAIFAHVPDRQRTIRELEVGRTLVKDLATGAWNIQHAPADYKTGKSYGARPPLALPVALTYWIDSFIRDWRPCLRPQTNVLLAQPRTGNPLTQDSVYQMVSRCCFEHTGKRTNPHLLRDMIVTHVRDSDASEKELEALALFMGHSLYMQRTSYDRRTLIRKVAPAVQLMQNINQDLHSKDDVA